MVKIKKGHHPVKINRIRANNIRKNIPLICQCRKNKIGIDGKEILPINIKKKKSRKKKRSQGTRRQSQYPSKYKSKSKTFYIKYNKKLSSISKALLNSFQNKYLYYAIDDILYSLKSNPIEQENLLTILYSPIVALQNQLSINFFDIWIKQIYIYKDSKTNKFLANNDQNFDQFHYITIKFLYKVARPIKKSEELW